MRARDLVQPLPTVHLDSGALEAARVLGARTLPGLIVIGPDGLPCTILPGSQVLRLLVPKYVQDDETLARVYDEQSADLMSQELAGKSVGDLLPHKEQQANLPVVDQDATVMEVAARMARERTPLVAVVDEDQAYLGAITVTSLLSYLVTERIDDATGAASGEAEAGS